MSLYADYLKEITDDEIIESELGFVTYRHLPDQSATYIIDIYVIPEARLLGKAAKFADDVSKIAKAKGFKKVIGTVVPSKKHSTESLKALVGYGMMLKSAGQDFIILEKDI